MNELEIIRHQQMEGFSIFFDTVEYRTSHFHPEWELIWILEQPLSVACGMERYLVKPGEMVLFNPNEPHEFHKAEESCTFLCLQISANVLPPVGDVHIDGKLPLRYLTEEGSRRLKAALSGLCRAYLEREEYFALYCMGNAALILHMLLKSLPSHVLTPEETDSIGRRNDRLKRLIRFVDENYMHKIRLADFARAEGCSLSYLSRFIKNTMNQNFQDYVTSVRFNCACKLIAAGGKRMLDVCMESGFSDYRYFSREFKRQYGMTPEEYSSYAKGAYLEAADVRHSLHSVERFYSREESLKLADRYFCAY